MAHELNRKCPLCDSDSRSVKKFFNEYTVVACDQCGFLYVGNPASTTTSEDNVDLDDARYKSIPEPKRRHHYTVNLLDKQFGSGAKVLEIGAGYGPLGKLLNEKGYQYTGFEPSEVRTTVAAKEGVNIVNDTYDADSVAETYDAVVLDNVIEHVRHPKKILYDATINLKKTGIIIVIVPSRYDLRRIHPGWNKSEFWIPHAHINFFRPHDLKRLYDAVGLKMQPFPSKVFGMTNMKDRIFTLKALVEKSGWYPASLYTFGSSK